MKNSNYQVLKIGKLVGGYYSCGQKTKTIIVYGIGAPTVPDNGLLPDAPIILEHKIDLFLPDYLGFGRSDGKFTPLNCIKTLLILYDMLKKGCLGINIYQNDKLKLKYKRIIFIGRSLGGSYVPLLPRFNKDITEIALFYPSVDNKSAGSVKGEESNEDFLRTMEQGGYCYLYRGVLSPIWKKHLNNEDGLSPMDNIKYLKSAKIFIAHGKKDKVIHFSKSIKYHQEILKTFPSKTNDIVLKLYPEGDHGQKTTKKAMGDFIKWLDL